MNKYRHIKSGGIYTYICTANSKTDRKGFVKTAVYKSEDETIYSRPYSEFVDKFELMNTAHTQHRESK